MKLEEKFEILFAGSPSDLKKLKAAECMKLSETACKKLVELLSNGEYGLFDGEFYHISSGEAVNIKELIEKALT